MCIIRVTEGHTYEKKVHVHLNYKITGNTTNVSLGASSSHDIELTKLCLAICGSL